MKVNLKQQFLKGSLPYRQPLCAVRVTAILHPPLLFTGTHNGATCV